MLAHLASERDGLDFLLEPDVLVAIRLTRGREPVTETDPRPPLVGEQNDHAGAVAGSNGPQIEVLAESVDVRLPRRGSGRQGIAAPRSGSESPQVFHFLAVEPAAVIAHVLDPIQLPVLEGHRTTGRGHPPMDEGPLQPAVLLVEVVRLVVWIAFIAHRDSFSQNCEGGVPQTKPVRRVTGGVGA